MIPTSDYSWREFKERCYELQFHEDIYFRGQSDATWGLQPSFSRFADDKNLSRYFDTILPNAARHLSGYADYSFNLDNDNDRNLLLGLLQHHGFPTPLLDWSRSPYIAAFFAFIDYAFSEPTCDHVAIWTLNGQWVRDFLTEREGTCEFEYIQPDSRYNKRLLAQDGLFTLSKTIENLDQYLAGVMERQNHPGILQILRIPVEHARLALNDLHLMGLHPGTLFPGIDGACASLKIKHFVKSEFAMGISGRNFIVDTVERWRKSEDAE